MTPNFTGMIAVIERTPGLAGGRWTRGGLDCTVMALLRAAHVYPDAWLVNLVSTDERQRMSILKQVLFARYGLGESSIRALVAFNDTLHCAAPQRRDEVLALLRWLRDEWAVLCGYEFTDAQLATAILARGAAIAGAVTPEVFAPVAAFMQAQSVDLAPAQMWRVEPLTPDQVNALLSAGVPVLAGQSG